MSKFVLLKIRISEGFFRGREGEGHGPNNAGKERCFGLKVFLQGKLLSRKLGPCQTPGFRIEKTSA
jgi:hypothetical protein